MSGFQDGRRMYLGACVLALSALLVTYANHFRNDFHFDDSHTIQNNLYIRDLRNIPLFFTNTRTFSSNPANQSYRPLLTTTLAAVIRTPNSALYWRAIVSRNSGKPSDGP